jgi:protoporphyrinogen oxidase
MSNKTALIIGAGPAGLTAAYELLLRTGVRPIVLEKSGYMGGISRTVNYKGNRIDIGGHRFFSKSDRVMNWWMAVMPLEARNGAPAAISYQNKTRDVATSASGPSPDETDRVMLIRNRKSRIYFLRRFFDYPIKLSQETLAKLGLKRTIKIGFSYVRALVSQIKPEK